MVQVIMQLLKTIGGEKNQSDRFRPAPYVVFGNIVSYKFAFMCCSLTPLKVISLSICVPAIDRRFDWVIHIRIGARNRVKFFIRHLTLMQVSSVGRLIFRPHLIFKSGQRFQTLLCHTPFSKVWFSIHNLRQNKVISQ